MGKKREPPPEEGAPLWMCTFGDLMSLLLCFFIMLFAISIISEPRFQAVADTLTQEFMGFAGPSRESDPSSRITKTLAESAAKSRRIAALTGGQPTPGPQGTSTEVHAILVDGTTVRDGLVPFELGLDRLSAQAQWQLRTIFPVLHGSPHKIMVKGYSAPTEEGGTELAFLRALRVADYLIELGLSQDSFEIVFEPATLPQLTLLPPGTDPELTGAFVEILLLNQTSRALRE